MIRLLNRCNSCENLKIKQHSRALKCCIVCFRRKSYYEALGLNSSASAKDIKSAYYKLSLQFHPDKNEGSPESVSKFREITEAYEVLGNSEKRKIYDETGGSFQNNNVHNEQYYRPPSYYRRTYTGKTKDFDYDEHFRQHYKEYEKTRQTDYDYFRRRWEAEYYRRYGNRDEFNYRNPASFNELKGRLIRRYTYGSLFMLFWMLFMSYQISTEHFESDKPKKRQPIYYEINKVAVEKDSGD